MTTPHLIQPDQFWLISHGSYAALVSRFSAALPSVPAGSDPLAILRQLHAQRPPATMEAETGIAHLHLFGPLARNLSPVERALGTTDYSQFEEEFSAALAAGARGILLHVDSPGGTVSGTPEIGALVERCPVPIVAHAAQSCSAAYWISCCADYFVADTSATVGSIGVVLPRKDMSGLMEKLGVVDDSITNTGADLKGMDYTGALTPEQRAYLEAQADALAAAFHAAVARHRAIDPACFRGGTMFGPAALAANLVDALGTPAEARAALLARLPA